MSSPQGRSSHCFKEEGTDRTEMDCTVTLRQHRAAPRGHDRGIRGALLCVQASTCSTATENKTKQFPFLYWHNNTHSNFPSAEGDGVIFPILEWCLSDFVTQDSCYF